MMPRPFCCYLTEFHRNLNVIPHSIFGQWRIHLQIKNNRFLIGRLLNLNELELILGKPDIMTQIFLNQLMQLKI